MYSDENALSRYIVNELVTSCSGKKDEVCLLDKPSDRYFIGSLSPASDLDEDDFTNKIKPSSVGFDSLYVCNGEATFFVEISFSVFYKAYPDYNSFSNIKNINCYKRVDLRSNIIKINIDYNSNHIIANNDTDINIKTALESLVDRVHEIIKQDPLTFRNKTVMKRFENITSREQYKEEISSIDGEIVLPPWRPYFSLEDKKHEDNKRRIKVYLENHSENSMKNEYDAFFFDANISLRINEGSFVPYEFNLLPKDYRYDRELWGMGHNCNTIISDDKKMISIESAPVFTQKRYITSERVKPFFNKLSENPIEVLNDIKVSMIEFAQDWEEKINEIKEHITEKELSERNKDLINFKEEIKRFIKGIDVIQDKPFVYEAFCLMNKTFDNKDKRRKKPFKGWRLFQIVYIVMLIPDVVTREYKELGSEGMDYVDVLWFPTGGGKTETYLGLCIFTAFFDRLRGKKTGITSWIKFPLRLLSIQQFQRIVEIFAEAEKIRLSHEVIGKSGYDNFSIGYFVGGENTPNKLEKWIVEKSIADPLFLEKYKMLEKCPYCGSDKVSMKIDEYEGRLMHICNNKDCIYEKLPLYIVDKEIYRYLPTMVVSTVDKIAVVGYQRRAAHMFGNFDEKCKIHGVMSCGECTEDRNCDEERIEITPYDPSPEIIIQDELHLLKESFGTFASHYESFIDVLQQEINDGSRAKMIAATATIEEYEYQVKHLYNRKARKFPMPGYEFRNNFYACEIESPARIFIGVMPHNTTHLEALKRLLSTFHELIQIMKKVPDEYINKIGFENIKTREEFFKLIDYYEVSLMYANSRDDVADITRLISNQIEPDFLSRGLKPPSHQALTSRNSFMEIKESLNKLEEPYLYSEDERINSVVATSLISHGVDVDRLNFMIFYGMPGYTSEYIQSSSRVGRSHIGIDLVCFKPGRERDISYFNYFKKYNEFCDRLVEPVSINRWSKFSINKTLPGLFMALILQYYQPKYKKKITKNMFFSEGIREAILKGYIKEDDVIQILNKSYGIREDLEESRDFKKAIKVFVRNIFMAFKNPIEEKSGDQIKRAVDFSPMSSLRDIDSELIITADAISEHFIERLERRV